MTMQAKKTKFSDLHTTQIGIAGEKIVKEILQNKKYKVYTPGEDAPFPVDFVVMKQDGPTVNFIGLVDAKCFPRCHSYTRTGIDKRDFDTYVGLLQFLPVNLIFIDGFEGMVYSLPLRLEHENATFSHGKAWFELDAMTPLCKLSAADLRAIKYSPTPYYRGTKKFFI
jgi:hypothetical protein